MVRGGLQLSYNFINLPKTVTGPNGTIVYSFSADGTKVAVQDNSGTVIEQNDYYPFGGRHAYGQSYAQTTANRYKFNSKEEQTLGSLNIIEIGLQYHRLNL